MQLATVLGLLLCGSNASAQVGTALAAQHFLKKLPAEN